MVDFFFEINLLFMILSIVKYEYVIIVLLELVISNELEVKVILFELLVWFDFVLVWCKEGYFFNVDCIFIEFVKKYV